MTRILDDLTRIRRRLATALVKLAAARQGKHTFRIRELESQAAMLRRLLELMSD